MTTLFHEMSPPTLSTMNVDELLIMLHLKCQKGKNV